MLKFSMTGLTCLDTAASFVSRLDPATAAFTRAEPPGGEAFGIVEDTPGRVTARGSSLALVTE
jgi:hypothetical protein